MLKEKQVNKHKPRRQKMKFDLSNQYRVKKLTVCCILEKSDHLKKYFLATGKIQGNKEDKKKRGTGVPPHILTRKRSSNRKRQKAIKKLQTSTTEDI